MAESTMSWIKNKILRKKEKYIDDKFFFEGIKNQVEQKIRDAQIEEAFNLIEKYHKELKVALNDSDLLRANFLNSKKQFEQNLINKEAYDGAFSKTISGIHTILSTSIPKSTSKQFYKHNIYYIFITTSLLLLSVFLIFNISLFLGKDKLSKDMLESNFRFLNSRQSFEKKNKVISNIIGYFDVEAIVVLKSENGNILDKYPLEFFLTELGFEQHEDIYIESFSKTIIVVRYQ